MKLVIFGIGVLAELAYYYFRNDSDYEVVGFVVESKYIKNPTFLDLPLVPFEEIKCYFSASDHHIFIAIGYTDLNKVRKEKLNMAMNLKFQIASYISSKAVNFASHLGKNLFILENAVLQPFSTIGDGVIIWPGSVISHHSTIGNFSYVSPNATISGQVKIGDNTFIGSGSIVRDRVTIPADTILGAGSVVVQSPQNPGVYMGSPAKLIKMDASGTNI